MMIAIFNADHVWVSEGFLVRSYMVDRFKALPLKERARIWTTRSTTAKDAEMVAIYGEMTIPKRRSGESSEDSGEAAA